MFDYKIFKLKENEKKKYFLEIIKKITFKKLKEGFYFDIKYGFTEDLRKNNVKCPSFNFDTIFVDILFNQHIIHKIHKILKKPFFLDHIQFRNVYQNNNSYASWHRDTFIENNKFVGPIPQSIKLMFYPKFGIEEKCLSLKEKSNVLFDVDKKCLLKKEINKKIDSYNTNIISINNSNDEMLLFDTTTYHNAEMPQKNMFQPRIIYVFYFDKNQLKQEHDLYLYFKQKCINHNIKCLF